MTLSFENVVYYQAASSTSGGSSGSPVLNIHGEAIALNAGASSSASQSYYLPLNRVLRALRLLQRQQPISRGTLQVEWENASFDEARRLGFPYHAELELRRTFPERGGILMVKLVLPGGPAEGKLEQGDMLVRLQGTLVSHFDDLETILDDRVDHQVTLEVQRGDEHHAITVQVQDLHSITPDEYLEFGDSIIHSLSYQMARSFRQNVGSVFVACPGYSLANANIPSKSVITSVANIPTPSLSAFINVLSGLTPGDRVIVQYYPLSSNETRNMFAVLKFETEFFPVRLATRNDLTGRWEYKKITCKSSATTLHTIAQRNAQLGSNVFLTLGSGASPESNRILRSLVRVESRVPFLIEGTQKSPYVGVGLVLNGSCGLVLTDRSAVPLSMCAIELTFCNNCTSEATAVFMHPHRNYVILKYDPEAILEVPSAKLKANLCQFSSPEDALPESCYLIAFISPFRPIVRRVRILAMTEHFHNHFLPPRFRSMNFEQIEVDSAPITGCLGGVLTADDGSVFATWSGFEVGNDGEINFTGFPVDYVRGATEKIISKPTNRSTLLQLDYEVWPVPLAKAKMLGLPDAWVNKLALASPNKHTVLQVTNTFPAISNDHESNIQSGDLLLAVDGHLMTRPFDLLKIESKQTSSRSHSTWNAKIWRAGAELNVPVQPACMDVPNGFAEVESSHLPSLLGWCGSMFQLPYRQVLELVSSKHPLLSISACAIHRVPYVTCVMKGSPSEWSGLTSGYFVTKFRNRRLDLRGDLHWTELILEETKAAHSKNEEYVRLELLNRAGSRRVLSIRVDEDYWPTWYATPESSGKTTVQFIPGS